jgi:hypothetical protein
MIAHFRGFCGSMAAKPDGHNAQQKVLGSGTEDEPSPDLKLSSSD